MSISCFTGYKEEHLICSRQFCLPKGYDRIQLPPTPNSEPLDVEIEFDIVQFTAVDDRNFRVDFVTYMSMLWEEPRIVYTGNSSVPKTVSLGLDMAQHIWLPDIYIYNLKSVTMTSILREFAGKV